MAYPVWPSSLPDRPQQDSYSFSPDDNRATFKPSIGSSIDRLRSNVETSQSQVTFWMDDDQLTDFRNFWRYEIGQGALSFEMPDPITRDTMIYRISGKFTVNAISHNWWAVSMSLTGIPV